ncbi:helix-turn-helix transcriptional regulator [Spirillospora sp. CA-294931]|uniref:helix-turn-helix transcriptional regulator n=1 Tax=Spirillospora sp. CA-294931 TaxID=3240042 RepID=UPI003D9122ED
MSGKVPARMVQPGPMTSLVGRRREAGEIRSALGAGRLVTLIGPGGVGKTRLATMVAATVAQGLADGAVFVGLAELRDGALLPNLIADRLGLQDRSGQPVVRAVLDHLRDRELLLVLDNCEQLVDACAAFTAEVLAECPRVASLATSRQSLGVAGETVMRVAPLSVPPADRSCSPAEIDQYDGVRLFLDRASAAEPSFQITTGNCDAVVRVCRQLDGLPLAIELAAARIRVLSPQQIADRLAGGLALLTVAPRTAPDRHQTLRAAIGWSYELCSAAERGVWRRASVFAGSFDLDAAEQVCPGPEVAPDGVLDAIDGLLDKSVLVRDERDGIVRYQMLETLREYGQEKLEDEGALAAAVRRHRDWVDRLTATADAEWVSPRQVAWIHRLRLERANLRAALDRCMADPEDAGVALRIASRLHECWTTVGVSLESREWLDRSLAAASPDDPGRARALAVCAVHALFHAGLDLALARLDEAETAPGSDDERARAFVTGARGFVAMVCGDPAAAALSKAAADAFEELGDVRHALFPLYQYGMSIADHGDLEAARRALRRVIALSESYGEVSYRGVALFGTTSVEVEHGDVEAAAASAREGLKVVQALRTPFGDAYHLESLAWVAARRGDHERAATLFGAAAEQWDAIGSTPSIAVPAPHGKHKRSTLDALGPERFQRLFDAGRALTTERTLRFALGEADPPPDAVRPDDLTKREWEIAELVAAGLSNRDIAARLFISPRTADTHVQNILVKLGFQNRVQVAAWFATRTARPMRRA